MRSSHISYFAVMLVVLAIAVAGCTGGSPSAPASGTPATTAAGSATPAGGSTLSGSSASPAPGSVVTGAGIFGTGASYNWIEYRMTMEGMTAFMKFEKSGKCTMRMEGKDLPGGTMTIDCSQKGQASSVPSENPAEVKSDVKFTFVGIDPVTVPAGTYPTASKYSVTSEGNTVYYWTAPGVPTFVKYQIAADNDKVVTELNGWG